MLGGRIVVGFLTVTTLISVLNGAKYSAQDPATPTQLPRRSAPTAVPLGVATFVVTVTLTDSPIDAVITEAKAEGLTNLQLYQAAVVQGLRIAEAQSELIAILTQPPYEAVLIDQAMREQNSLTIQVRADRLEEIQALPGVLSVRAGATFIPPTEERPPRGDIPSGTRLPPLQPPGYN